MVVFFVITNMASIVTVLVKITYCRVNVNGDDNAKKIVKTVGNSNDQLITYYLYTAAI